MKYGTSVLVHFRRILPAAVLLCGLSLGPGSAGCDSPEAPDDGGSDGGAADAGRRYFQFAVISDTHIIDKYYTGPESNEEDTRTMFLTKERLEYARGRINAMDPPIDLTIIPGDFIHNYPSQDWNFYLENQTRIDIAKSITDAFDAPVYPALGNHDYDIPSITREFTRDLFKLKLGMDPYYKVDYEGFRFIILNNFLGATCDPSSPDYNQDFGSLGREQLTWLDGLLAEKKPAFIFLHYPLGFIKAGEFEDIDLLTLLQKYKGTIKMVFAGHMHTWLDFEKQFGPRHWAIGSTRYNQDSFLLVRVDLETGGYRILNEQCIKWVTRDAYPWDPQKGCIK
jgi:hypothetical protein